MQENNLFKLHKMQEVLDDLDVIVCFEIPGEQLQVGEITKRQMDFYTKSGDRLQPRYNNTGIKVLCSVIEQREITL